ncbi:RidA family protein [Nocardia yamanashiensis]|uniref:RidA family protein n=1 Tax=Nocardia yamanashiensis TaxID=209247 RepID=UPI00083050A0|nr:RidA family protein [Nocardia yamanashiensis]
MSLVTHINPESLPASPAFSQAVRVSSAADTIYVGGQNGIDASGQLVGPTLKEQSRQALTNVRACLLAAGADLENIVKWTMFVADGEPVRDGYEAFLEIWGARTAPPPAITVLTVAAFARPGVLCEIEAIAAVPATSPQG